MLERDFLDPKTFKCISCKKIITMSIEYFNKNGSTCPVCKNHILKLIEEASIEMSKARKIAVGIQKKGQIRRHLLDGIHERKDKYYG